MSQFDLTEDQLQIQEMARNALAGRVVRTHDFREGVCALGALPAVLSTDHVLPPI
jgi:hypothetical protein